MSKRITITHTEDISCLDAVRMVKLAMENSIDRGTCMTFSNDLAVDMAKNTKFPSYYVWKIKNK